jgi:Holliday junction resolvasome RuvABC endonuclease subunit
MKVILALYPNSRGFGYACIELAEKKQGQKILASGIMNVRPVGNERTLKHIRKFAEYFKPELVILRDYRKATNRGKRIRELITSIVALAQEYRLPVYRYTREQIRHSFEQYGAKTKYEISQKILEGFPELASRAPRIRKVWEEEDYRMGAFDALALVATHEYLH